MLVYIDLFALNKLGVDERIFVIQAWFNRVVVQGDVVIEMPDDFLERLYGGFYQNVYSDGKEFEDRLKKLIRPE